MAISPFEERYRTDMSRIFEDQNKYDKWMDVEIALAKAHSELGNISKKDYENIKNAKEKVKPERIIEIENEIHHDKCLLTKISAIPPHTVVLRPLIVPSIRNQAPPQPIAPHPPPCLFSFCSSSLSFIFVFG